MSTEPSFSDLLPLVLEGLEDRRVVHIEMTIGDKSYTFHAAPKGVPHPPVINWGTYTPSEGLLEP